MDASIKDVSTKIVSVVPKDKPKIYFALHVSALNMLNNQTYLESLKIADGLYADGASLVLLAKLRSGARSITRAPTTDLGKLVLSEFSQIFDRPPRVALIGGPDGLASRAGRRLEELVACKIVFTNEGYFDDLESVLEGLKSSTPDFVFVGLGAPLEMMWVSQNVSRLPTARIMTCGGWFSFITGEEKRAPRVVQTAGLEWLWRLAQHPRRLFRRYGLGLYSFLRLLTAREHDS